MILVIDNFDSFTWNLAQYLMQLGEDVKVVRNNAINISEIETMNPEHILISPGPGRPDDAGISLETISFFKGKIPILGVCLGHQAIGQHFGGEIISGKQIMHGKISAVYHKQENIFKGIKSPFNATRYHSLAISRDKFPENELIITAETEDGEIMGIAHKTLAVYGVQFHPESILSEFGMDILKNFLYVKI